MASTSRTKSADTRNVVGLDIGYSNLKVAFSAVKSGDDNAIPETLLRPAGAAPEERFSKRFDGGTQAQFVNVLVGDKQFIAGVSPDEAELWERSLHPEYTSTDSYTALMHAGLLLTGMSEIDTLVTGLPVSQYYDPARKQALIDKFKGEHKVTPKRTITVKDVFVVAQPVGGYVDYLDQQAAKGFTGVQIEDDMRVLTVDPGFFSLDWALIADSSVKQESSGTSVKASSVLLETAARLIGREYGVHPTVEQLEKAFRANKGAVRLAGELVEIAPFIKTASAEFSSTTADALRRSLRKENLSPDIVLLVGGGADFFRDAIQEAFPRLKVVSPAAPELANARGFFRMGVPENE